MLNKIKNKVERELKEYARNLDKITSLKKISPILSCNIKDYILNRGKRLRPVLFVMGYLGFKNRVTPGLYRCALAFELLHDFLLVHDDIIDKSAVRRGRPSMHEMFNRRLARHKNIKFNGQDLSIVAGDILFALSIHAFLSIKEEATLKEIALKKFIDSVVDTGGGEFIELLYGLKNIDKITQIDIYKIYDLKTASYTFSSPLSIGAILSGAGNAQSQILNKFGIYLGRAFQIKDDIIGMFGKVREIGKSNLTDLQEAKKTLLIHRAYHNSSKKDRLLIRKILSKEAVTKNDLILMRDIIKRSGALDFAEEEISGFKKKAKELLASSKMNWHYKNALLNYTDALLNLQ